ncbi:hypothetical protein [Methylobacterium oryzisoli]|uniref:hypothetical protein n=1 Tax=Methylobacterium oryzisoli TaxID=3385502 RepID=UPI0038923E40
MIPWRLLVAGGLLLAAPVCAHEASGRNGGRVADAGPYHLELVARERTVDVYVLDGAEAPLPAAGFTATAFLMIDGKPARIALAPAGGSRLTGLAEAALPAAPKGAVQLTAPDGSRASARFN